MAESFVTGPKEGFHHTHTVIFLHGRDSLAEEFASELFESEASDDIPVHDGLRTLPNLFPTIRWVFPAAPMITCQRFEMSMSQWFDMWSVENPNERSELQEEGLRKSIAAIKVVISQEEKQVYRQKIFLAGISQGFATAISTFLSGDKVFAGLIGLSSWLPFSNDDAVITFRTLQGLVPDVDSRNGSEPNESQRKTPVFLGHSADDEVVPIDNGKRMCQSLRALLGNESVQWHEYEDGGHWVNEPQEVDDLFKFLNAHMC